MAKRRWRRMSLFLNMLMRARLAQRVVAPRRNGRKRRRQMPAIRFQCRCRLLPARNLASRSSRCVPHTHTHSLTHPLTHQLAPPVLKHAHMCGDRMTLNCASLRSSHPPCTHNRAPGLLSPPLPLSLRYIHARRNARKHTHTLYVYMYGSCTHACILVPMHTLQLTHTRTHHTHR